LVAELPAAGAPLQIAAARPDRAAATFASHGRSGRSHPRIQVVRFHFTYPAPLPAA
jgi:hypothetical protein